MLLTDALALSHVPRWSVVRHSHPQSVADHSFRVAIIYVELHKRLQGRTCAPSVVDLWEALVHDLDEAVTGDMPSFSKSHAEPKDKLLKAADLIESYTYMVMHAQGNHAAEVAMTLKRQLTAFCTEYDIPLREVWSMCDSILFEEGRLQATTTPRA